MRRFFIVLAAVFVSLVVIVGVVFALIDLDAIANDHKGELTSALEEALGRPVRLGSIETRKLPLTITARELVVEGRTADEPVTLSAKAVVLKVDLWRALISFGSDIAIDKATIEGLKIALQRDRDGTWSIEDVIKRRSAQGDAGADKAGESFVDRVRLSDVKAEEGVLRLVDYAIGPDPVTTTVGGVDVTLGELRPGAPIRLDVNAAVLGEDDDLTVAFRARDKENGVWFDFEALELATLARHAGLPELAGATVDGSFTAWTRSETGEERAAAKLSVYGLDASDVSPLTGSVTFQFDGWAVGPDPASWLANARGNGNVEVSAAKLPGTSLHSLVSDLVGRELPTVGRPAPGTGLSLGDVNVGFALDPTGLTLKPSAMPVANSELRLTELTGHVGFEGALDLRGSLVVSPAAWAAATGGISRPDSAIPIGLRITGTPKDPRVSLDGVDDALRALLPKLPDALAPKLPIGINPGQPGKKTTPSLPTGIAP